MTPDELFEAALQLAGTPWRVVRSDFSGKPPVLELILDFSRGAQFQCPQCGQLCGVHDTTQKRWRHLNFFQYRCELVANVPRVWCRQDGVHLINQLPWASPSSGFTLLFEAFVIGQNLGDYRIANLFSWLGLLTLLARMPPGAQVIPT